MLVSIRKITDIIQLFADTLSPDEMRTVVLNNKLTAGLESRRSTVIDGPAFYEANDLMSEIKKRNMYFSIRTGVEDLDKIIEFFIICI